MIREIRDYFKQQIKSCDSSLLEYKKDIFGNNDVSVSQAQKYYRLTILPSSIERFDTSFQDQFEATLSLWSYTGKDDQASFDELYDKAFDIRNKIFHLTSIYAFNPISIIDIEPVSMTPNEELTNDKTIRIDILFIVKIASKF